MAQKTEVRIPDIGDFESVPVIEVLVAEGDAVEKDQPLLVLESDKATMEVPSPAAGTVTGIALKVGDRVGEGARVCFLEAAEAAPKPPVASAPADKPASKSAAADPAPAPAKAPDKKPDSKPSDAQVDVRIPDIGDFESVPVIEVLVAEGDTVEKDQPLLVLESDKATMEVPSPAAGTVTGLAVKVGDRVAKGAPVCVLHGSAPQAAPSKQASTQSRSAAPPTSPPKPGPQPQESGSAPAAAPARKSAEEPALPDGRQFYAGPATRKFARQLGVDLGQVRGSGARGRILIEDVQAHVKARLSAPSAAAGGGGALPAIPAQDFSRYGPIETRPLARIRKLSAAHLQRAWLNVPHVTQHDRADITELEAFRKQVAAEQGTKLTLLPFLIKAVSVALKAHPQFNSSLAPDGESLILKQYCHIGFAADTEQGLVVPVVRDVWRKSLSELGADCAELAQKARSGKLKAEEMRGGCFSISSLGGIGGGYFTPIVNAPEVAILGASRAVMEPVWDGQTFQPRLMLPLSLSYDHRVIDGAAAARFIVLLVKLLSDLRQMSL